MEIDPAFVGVISACTALAASITGPLVSLHVARSQIRASVRSANRQRWIEDFRDTVSKLCGQVAVATQLQRRIFEGGRVSISAEQDLHQFEHLIATTAKIRLMINPLDDDHQRLVSLVDRLLHLFRTAAEDDDVQGQARALAMQVIDLGTSIIRQEWVRVQRGS